MQKLVDNGGGKFWTVIENGVGRELSDACFRICKQVSATFPNITVKDATLKQPLLGILSNPSGKDIRYFHTYIKSQPWSLVPELDRLAKIAKDLTGYNFNVAYINFYRPGNYIPYHKDKTHGDEPIVSFTFYDNIEVPKRDLLIRSQSGECLTIPTTHGQIIIMHPGMQPLYDHAVTSADGERVNVTLRIDHN